MVLQAEREVKQAEVALERAEATERQKQKVAERMSAKLDERAGKKFWLLWKLSGEAMSVWTEATLDITCREAEIKLLTTELAAKEA